jgi:hypothetical protein
VEGASPAKVISPERALVLPPISDGDKYETQIVQLETIHLNGLCAVDLLKSLLGLVNRFSEDVTQLKSGNVSLKVQLNTIQKSVDIKSRITYHSTASSLPPQPISKDVARRLAGTSAATQSASTASSVPVFGTFAYSRVLSYNDVASAGLSPQVASPADSDGFVTVSRKRKTIVAPAVKNIKSRRQPLIGVRNSTSLPSVSKKERSKASFVSRFSPEVIADDVEKSLKEQLSLKKLVCTRLKIKFSTYASLHVSVIEYEFPLINNNGVWPAECLIASLYGKPTPDQVYFLSTPVIGNTFHQ